MRPRGGRTDFDGASRWLLAATVAFGLLACVTRWGAGRNDAPPQGWWSERGPVVPHDSFPADCRLCHVGDDWQSLREDFAFDHAAETGMALVGAHAGAECLRCHNDRGPVEVFAERGCAGCHEDVHRGQLGSDCSLCHDQETWEGSRPETLLLHERTRFPLVGAHVSAPCWRCHTGAETGNFTPVDTECVTCHADDLARATDPDHVAAGFTMDCERCHAPTTWTASGFVHSAFPLTGAHRGADCSACHPGGVYAGTPRDCFACHMDDYQGAPDHVANNFPTSCENCHDTSSWENARFDHTGITSGCVDCHLDDYLATTDPDHQAAGFPTSCEQCHEPTRWEDAEFSHSFPISSGAHRTLDCSDCHTMPSNYSFFSCIDCHEHEKTQTDADHDEVSGYVYESGACLACHQDGKK